MDKSGEDVLYWAFLRYVCRCIKIDDFYGGADNEDSNDSNDYRNILFQVVGTGLMDITSIIPNDSNFPSHAKIKMPKTR
jgi:hypothetical protein